METIVEEDDKELNMYERESLQAKQNLKIDELNGNQKRKISVGSTNSNNSNRFTKLNDTVLNAVETFQVENEKDLIESENNEDIENNNNENMINENNNINGENININDNDENNNNILKTSNTKREKLKEHKIIVLGDFGVGKSSLIYRYFNNKFNKEIEEAPNFEDNKKIIQIDEDTKLKVNIWDTAGQEKSGKILKVYYKDIYGAILVFDLTNKESFKNLKNWLNDLKENAPRDTVYCFLGNKSDLINERKVELEEIKDFVQDNLYYEVSSKNGTNVSLAFEQLAYNIVEKQAEEEGNPDKVIRGAEGRKTHDLRADMNEKDLKQKKICC